MATSLPICPDQIVASLQDALEADRHQCSGSGSGRPQSFPIGTQSTFPATAAAGPRLSSDVLSAEVTPVASGQACWAAGSCPLAASTDEESGFNPPAEELPGTGKGELCQVAVPDIDVSSRAVSSMSASMSAVSTAVSPPKNRTASVERLQTELFSLTMACVDGGFVRECSVLPPPSVEPLPKVSPFPPCCPPSSNHQHPDGHQLTPLPISEQIVASLHGRSSSPLHEGEPPLNYSEEDAAGQEGCTGEAEAVGTSAPCAQVLARDQAGRDQEGRDQEGAANGFEGALAPSRDTYPEATNRTASVARLQTELFTLTMDCIDDGDPFTP